jgi:hypothetical protein
MNVPYFSTINPLYTHERQRVRTVLRVEKSHFDHELCTYSYIGPSNKYIFRVGVGDILILLIV